MQEVLSVSNDVAAELAGVGDGVLETLRDRLRCTIRLRGNRLTIEGEDELEEIVDEVIAEVGATSLRDLGRVMADVMPQVAGRTDGSVVSQIVREKLA